MCIWSYMPDFMVNLSVDFYWITLNSMRSTRTDRFHVIAARKSHSCCVFIEFLSMTNPWALSDTGWLQLRAVVYCSSIIIAGRSYSWISRSFQVNYATLFTFTEQMTMDVDVVKCLFRYFVPPNVGSPHRSVFVGQCALFSKVKSSLVGWNRLERFGSIGSIDWFIQLQ